MCFAEWVVAALPGHYLCRVSHCGLHFKATGSIRLTSYPILANADKFGLGLCCLSCNGMSDVGTLAWARRTGGRLSFRDRVTLARGATTLLLRNMPSLFVYRAGLQRRFPELQGFEAMKAPDSATARAAEEKLQELTPPFMGNHSLRTYWFSRLLGEASDLKFDDEVLYVSSLLHDIGFYGRHAEATPETECFGVRGANAALALANEHGWDAERGESAAERFVYMLTVPQEWKPA